MSKRICVCGHIIVDQREDLPYKAEYIADEDYEASYGDFITFVTELVEAREHGEQERFIIKRFGEQYPRDLDLSDVISDALTAVRVGFGHTMYECEQCGRLWIQPNPEKDRYVSYLPETETRGVLRSRRSEI